MFDLKWIRDNSAAFDAGLKARGVGPTAARVIALDEKRREALTAAQEIQARRNKLSKEIGIAKTKGEDVSEMIRAVSAEEELQAEAEERVRQLVAGLDELLEGLPNLAADDVPVGEDASANVVLRTVGVRPEFDFTPKEHFEIGAGLGQMDFERAAKMSGARFVVLTGALARLERALAQFMLDLHTTEFGYTEVSPPLLVRDDAVFGTGNLPKFADDLFVTRVIDDKKFQEFLEQRVRELAGRAAEIINEDNRQTGLNIGNWTAEEILKVDPNIYKSTAEDILRSIKEGRATEFVSNLWLIPTAEVPLTNLVRERILDEGDLPLRFTAFTGCFRSEAGSYGKETRGIVRQHQFQKVELVKFVRPEQSYEELESLTREVETVLQQLGLPYRVVALSTGDLGFAAAKTYDLEVWLPGENGYKEISSCSNFEGFQARRAGIRYRLPGKKKSDYVHTLNGSGLAIGRTWMALVENYQQADGTVVVPEVLRPYLDGVERLEAS